MVLGDVGVIRGDLRQARRNMYAVRAKFEPMAGDMGTLEKEILAIGDDIDEIAECTMTIEDVTCLIPKRMMAMEDDLRSIRAAMTELLRRVPQTSTPVTHLLPTPQAYAAPQLNTTTTQQAPAHSQAQAYSQAPLSMGSRAPSPLSRPDSQSHNTKIWPVQRTQAPQNLHSPPHPQSQPQPQLALVRVQDHVLPPTDI
jgi:hypothetical protein